MNTNKNKRIALTWLFVLACLLCGQSLVYAQNTVQVDIQGSGQTEAVQVDSPDNFVSRGETVHTVVQSFDLANKQQKFIKDCLYHLDECFFSFMARSDYDEIRFQPLILYPDVFPAYKYYKDINLASMLGVVQGYLDFNKTPFKPEDPVSRIQALKIVLVAANLVPWKEKFELSDAEMKPKLLARADTGDEEGTWWYARYLNFALDAGIIKEEDFGLADERINQETLNEMIEKTSAYLNKLGASGNGRKLE